MVVLGRLDLGESRLEVASSEMMVGSCEVVGAVAFVGACCAGLVHANRMMAMH